MSLFNCLVSEVTWNGAAWATCTGWGLSSYTTTKEACKKYTGQCLGVLFFPFQFFSLSCIWDMGYSASLISCLYSYRFRLVWFGGQEWLLVLEKKQISYIILFACIWSEHIFFPMFLLFLSVSVSVCALKNKQKKEKKKKEKVELTYIYFYIYYYILFIYLFNLYIIVYINI